MRYNRLSGPLPWKKAEQKRVNASGLLLSDSVAAGIAAMGKFASDRGWVPATSGNFSVRVDARHIAITRSGVDKGNIGRDDVALLCLEEAIPPGVSAETPLHVGRYRADPGIGAIMHVHSVASTVLSRIHAAEGSLTLQGYEMLKALEGVSTHDGAICLPVFANSQDTAALAAAVSDASEQARTIAEAARIRIVGILHIQDNTAPIYRPNATMDTFATGRLMAAAAPPPVPTTLPPGDLDVRASISVTYAIAP